MHGQIVELAMWRWDSWNNELRAWIAVWLRAGNCTPADGATISCSSAAVLRPGQHKTGWERREDVFIQHLRAPAALQDWKESCQSPEAGLAPPSSSACSSRTPRHQCLCCTCWSTSPRQVFSLHFTKSLHTHKISVHHSQKLCPYI